MHWNWVVFLIYSKHEIWTVCPKCDLLRSMSDLWVTDTIVAVWRVLIRQEQVLRAATMIISVFASVTQVAIDGLKHDSHLKVASPGTQSIHRGMKYTPAARILHRNTDIITFWM